MKHRFAISAAFALATLIVSSPIQILPRVHAEDATTTTPAASSTSLQAQIDANNQQIATLNQEIATDQAALQQAGADKKTLQAAIDSLDLQRNKVETEVAVTERQIATTKLEITQLGGEIVDTKQTIATDQAALGASLLDFQKTEGQPLLMQILSFNTLSAIWGNANANLEIQGAIQKNMQALQAQKNDLAASQTASQQKQQSLAAQQQSLAATVQSKNQLLAETSAKESIYEKLLAAAEAQLKSFSTFAENAGGSGLLGNQTVCDAWGCYYNQRDTAWGNDSLDGTSFRLASDGCLIASMAMVMTHYGYRNVTPVTINSNPDNFAAYYPASLLETISVDGMSATRKAATINATLATGNPVIVGLYAYGGTHFVVLTSGSGGSYLMRDPYITNGIDISFSAHYSLRNIFSIAKVVISS